MIKKPIKPRPAIRKLDLANRLADELLIDPQNALEIVNRISDYIIEGLMANRQVIIENLGTFELNQRPPHHYYNFGLKKVVMPDKPYTWVRFKVSAPLRFAVCGLNIGGLKVQLNRKSNRNQVT